MLAAYRTGHITPEQLARELQKLNARKASLLQDVGKPQPKTPIPFESIEAACKHLSGRLDQMNGHEKRELVRMLVDKVVFYGDRADVFGVLPVNANTSGHEAVFSNRSAIATADFHDRRKILHCNVTRQPNALWIVLQPREAWGFEQPHRFLIFDRDSKFCADVISAVRQHGAEPVRTCASPKLFTFAGSMT